MRQYLNRICSKRFPIAAEYNNPFRPSTGQLVKHLRSFGHLGKPAIEIVYGAEVPLFGDAEYDKRKIMIRSTIMITKEMTHHQNSRLSEFARIKTTNIEQRARTSSARACRASMQSFGDCVPKLEVAGAWERESTLIPPWSLQLHSIVPCQPSP